MVVRSLYFGRAGSGRPAANTFGCDIYIQANESRVNVKNYEELQRTLGTQSGSAEMHFDGTDEQEAEIKFQQIAEE